MVIKRNDMRHTLFYDMFIEPFEDGFWMALVGILMWLIMLSVVGLILYGCLYLVDSVGVQERHGTGIVIEKWFEPAHTSTTYINVSKVMIPQTHYYPDAWYIKVQVEDATDNVSLYKDYWSNINLNQQINCTYKTGRIWDSVYITNLN